VIITAIQTSCRRQSAKRRNFRFNFQTATMRSSQSFLRTQGRHCWISAQPHVPATQNAPELCISLRKQRAQETPGAQPHPQPRVRNRKAHEQVTTGSADAIRRFLRNGFNGLFRALPGEPGLLSPSPRNAKHCRELTPASGRQDHTALPSARWRIRLAHQKRPPHPASNVRDDRDTPLLWARDDGINSAASTVRRSELFLREGLDRDFAK